MRELERRLRLVEEKAGATEIMPIEDAIDLMDRLERPPAGYTAEDRARDEETLARDDAVMRRLYPELV